MVRYSVISTNEPHGGVPRMAILQTAIEERARVDGAGRVLTDELLARWRSEFGGNFANRLAQNAAAQVIVDDLGRYREIVTSIDHAFSHKLDDWSVTNQKRSGRCWMFAGLNLFRVGAMKKMGLKSFEFSQNYTMYWDKMERANYFLETII